MYRLQITGACAALVAFLGTGSTASAADSAGAEMVLGYRVLAPSGFRAYCLRTPSDCVSSTTAVAAPSVEADVATPLSSDSLWTSAFAQVRAQHGFPTGSIGARHAAATTNWRLRLRPQRIAPVVGASDNVVVSETRPSSLNRGGALPARIVLDAATRRMLQRVNQAVNAQIVPAQDETLYNGKDVWGAQVGIDGRLHGDCEDYVLAKRSALLAQGVPASALSIAVAHNGGGQTHAVLVVTTDKGDYVLDNLSFWVLPWRDLPYQWIMRQNHGDSADWRAVLGVDRPVRNADRVFRGWRR